MPPHSPLMPLAFTGAPGKPGNSAWLFFKGFVRFAQLCPRHRSDFLICLIRVRENLLEGAEQPRRAIDVVVVWRFDRFARSLKNLIAGLELCRARGIDGIRPLELRLLRNLRAQLRQSTVFALLTASKFGSTLLWGKGPLVAFTTSISGSKRRSLLREFRTCSRY